jgi:3-isopropylmalate/(R)-2-methylmalate dehydratase small subunit
MQFQGRAWKYGDNVNTDVIFPGKYTYTISDPAQMALHALEDLDPRFASQAKPGDIVVGGSNWGCGSSREQAVTCLAALGIKVLVAKSIARIYFRNAVNGGILPVVSPQAAEAIQDGEVVTVDSDQFTVTCSAGTFEFPALSPSLKAILEAGGLIPMLKAKLAEQQAGASA